MANDHIKHIKIKYQKCVRQENQYSEVKIAFIIARKEIM